MQVLRSVRAFVLELHCPGCGHRAAGLAREFRNGAAVTALRIDSTPTGFAIDVGNLARGELAAVCRCGRTLPLRARAGCQDEDAHADGLADRSSQAVEDARGLRDALCLHLADIAMTLERRICLVEELREVNEQSHDLFRQLAAARRRTPTIH